MRPLAAQLGLDRPPLEHCAAWLRGLLGGDLGINHAHGSPIAALIGEQLAAARLACVVSGLGGALVAVRPGDPLVG